ANSVTTAPGSERDPENQGSRGGATAEGQAAIEEKDGKGVGGKEGEGGGEQPRARLDRRLGGIGLDAGAAEPRRVERLQRRLLVDQVERAETILAAIEAGRMLDIDRDARRPGSDRLRLRAGIDEMAIAVEEPIGRQRRRTFPRLH